MSRTQQEEQNDHECELAAWELLREAKAKIEELKTQLGDAKATADLWMRHAKMADEAAADLKVELADTRRHWKEETEEQARLLGMSAERECDLRGKLERERALADRLAGYICDIHDVTSSRKVLKITTEACKTWWTHRKEARSE